MKKQGKIYGQLLTPIPTISVGSFILDNLRKGGDKPYLIDGCNDNQLTYREMFEKSVKLARFLQRYGIKVGDRIGIIAENRLNWFIPACAAMYIGAIFTPYNPQYTEWELQNLIPITKPRLIFVSRRTEGLLVKMLPTLPWQVELMQLDDMPLAASIRTLTNILNTEEDVDVFEYKPTDIGDSGKCPVAILYSSGTTGPPKGVVLSHRNVVTIMTLLSNNQYFESKEGDTNILFLPFYHGYAFTLLMTSLSVNSKAVVLPGFEPELFLKTIEKYKISRLSVVPPILTFLAKHPLVERYDFRSVREIMCGAAPVPKDLVSEVKLRLGVPYIRNAYGMTELSMVSNVGAPEDDKAGDISAISRLMPGLISKIINPETQETLDAGEVGEICFKGPQVMMGYWNNPEATRQTIDEDGWLHTGDVGYYDKKERLHVIDRLKELIKYKAYQVAPSEIELVLLTHPAVKDAAVIGKPDERCGEVSMALVVKQPNVKVTAEDVTEFIKRKLSPQKWLHGGVQFVDAIPKNPTGKILRREIRAMISKL